MRNKGKTNEDDFVITYSLDNYITIQGKIRGYYVEDAGYLIDGITTDGDNNYVYDGITFEKSGRWNGNTANSEGYIYNQDTNKMEKYEYTKINGTKYYLSLSRKRNFFYYKWK